MENIILNSSVRKNTLYVYIFHMFECVLEKKCDEEKKRLANHKLPEQLQPSFTDSQGLWYSTEGI